jgi:hypothetical protein
MRSVSTKERGGKPHKTPSLEEPSPGWRHFSKSVGLEIGYIRILK